MNKQVQDFINLVSENPSLPVICMTEYEVVCEDWGRWMSEIGSCYIGEYACYNDRFYDDRDDFMEDYYNNNDEDLDAKFGYFVMFDDDEYTEEQRQAHAKAEKELNEYLAMVADEKFKKAIIVNIDVPYDIEGF